MKTIVIRGAREHNLKNIDLVLPRDSLVVISGLSGSGKSSLAFDTIFAEGQRRYVESLSSYARQFLGRLDKPDLDYIEGLSPAIAIEQKSTHRNPRSTVGTVTEIYDYLRLLFARIGVPHCPRCGREIQEQSVDGEILPLEGDIALDRKRKHSIEIVVDRLVVSAESRRRFAESVEGALETSGGTLIAQVREKSGDREILFSQKSACPSCGISIPEMQPRLFSFNNPFGACEKCSGLGVTLEFDPALVVPDMSLSFNEGGIAPYNPKANWHRSQFESLAKHFKFSLDTPLEDLSGEVFEALLHGTKEKIGFRYESRDGRGKWEYQSGFRGVLNDLRRRYLESSSEQVKEWMEGFMSQKDCEACSGRRLKPEVLAVTVGERNIHQLTQMSVRDALDFFSKLPLAPTSQKIARLILKEISARLSFMKNVGLSYLTLERRTSTLSGGEAQRIRLATQIGSSLVGVLYILDEPTIGLHQRDNSLLIETLKHLRDIGNTLIVVEHDEQTLRAADYVVDLGPGAGVHGGQVVAAGTLKEVCANPRSLTGQYLRGALTIERGEVRRKGNGKSIELRGAREHNLQGIDVGFPLGTLIAITGVSGSGKSTLLSDLLYPALSNRTSGTRLPEGAYSSLEGAEEIDKIINIDQGAIGRTPRSNPATYVGLFGPIRSLFSQLPEARAKGYKAGRFSFNVRGGRCEKCQGAGTIRIEMHFLPDVYVTCDACKGRRYNRETLDVHYKGKNIHDVLAMTVEESLAFFRHIPFLAPKLATLVDVGLGYVSLGQSALTLSGGEAQRVKLSLELSRKSTGRTFYILDEPTTGLHFADVKKLMEVLQKLVDAGNTIALIEHNLDVIKCADWVIDLRPEGGDMGGSIVAAGTPEQVSRAEGSWTGRFLKRALKKE